MTGDNLHLNYIYRPTKEQPANGFTVAKAEQMKMINHAITDILNTLLVVIC